MSPARTWPRLLTCVALFASGAAALVWEVLWQHHASLAVGVSAVGTAITLACTMAGMSLGAVLMGRFLRGRPVRRPLRVYAALELVIAAFGLVLEPGFRLLGELDAAVFARAEWLAPLVQVAGCFVLLGPPAAAMGATLPVVARAAPALPASIAGLYAVNTAGAVAGVLAAALWLIPRFGISLAGSVTVLVHVGAALGAWLLPVQAAAPVVAGTRSRPTLSSRTTLLLAFTTGLCVFALEVAWFRSLRAAFQSTTDSFAVMLAAVLVALAAGAALAPRLPRRAEVPAIALCCAATLVLALTPLVERLDLYAPQSGGFTWVLFGRLGFTLLATALPMIALGAVFPWLLDDCGAEATGRLYAMSTLGAVAGALGASWLLLPFVGASRGAWVAGLALAAVAVVVAPRLRWLPALAAGAGLAVAAAGDSGVGGIRAQGAYLARDHRVVASAEGPDATVSVVEHAGARDLVIDGFQTSGESHAGHYMAWMGRLPMILHPAPRHALVIGFGTGRTANAVRRENPERLDIVELSPAVLTMAPLFASNEGVLSDPRVRAIRMDGRAWLRRTDARYDVVTLEPMAPHFAGTNSLYSREFYALVASRLRPGGVVAQWVPLHLLSPEDAASACRTFQAELGAAALWVDPIDRTGILVGRRGDGPLSWPGLGRAIGRDLTENQILDGVRLEGPSLRRYGLHGATITDDNQLLAYGPGRREVWRFPDNATLHRFNLEVIDRLARASPSR